MERTRYPYYRFCIANDNYLLFAVDFSRKRGLLHAKSARQYSGRCHLASRSRTTTFYSRKLLANETPLNTTPTVRPIRITPSNCRKNLRASKQGVLDRGLRLTWDADGYEYPNCAYTDISIRFDDQFSLYVFFSLDVSLVD